MLTPKDIESSRNISGYRYVGYNPSGKSGKDYQAYDGRAAGPTRKHVWKGPRRATPLEAARDYCDYVNAKPITPDDLRDPNNASGYRYVGSATGNPAPGKRTQFWRAQGGGRAATGPVRHAFRGKTHTDPRDAAQEYCDWYNGQQRPQQSVKLNQPGHAKRDQQMVTDPEVADALGVLRDHRAQKRGRPGFIYCIAEETSHPINAFAVKVGYSVKPEARVGELQTGNPRPLVLLAKKAGTLADEAAIHAKYIKDNTVGEWFRPSIGLLAEFDIIKGGTA